VRHGGVRSPLAWLGGLIALYLAAPLVAFAARLGTTHDRGFHAPGLFPALYVSALCATISLALITALGVPLAYLLARSSSRLSSIVGTVVLLPLALPPLMSGIVLIYLVGPYTFLGRLFGGHLTDSLTGIVLAQTFVAAPFLIVAARAAFGTVDPALLEVAATLGHSEVPRFRHVALPVAAPGIRAGMLLAWLRAFGEYGAVIILAYNPFSLPVYTYNQFGGTGLTNTVAPTALALAVAVIVVALSRLRPRTGTRRTATVPAAQAPAVATPTPVGFDIDHYFGSFHLVLAHRPTGSRLAILGPSGSGKSSLLRCLAGLHGSTPGPVWYGERSVQEVAVERRRVGYVAQGFTLYPHLTTWEHMLFADGSAPPTAAYWLDHLRLEGLQDRYPSELSGGQRQRVGLAQALCRSPDLLLLDEPFSAVDVPVRQELRRELRRLQREAGLATVLVTHDPEEAAFLSDEVLVIADGRCLQSGPSREVFTRPGSPDVARLLGVPNLHYGLIAADGQIEIDGSFIAASPVALEPGTQVLWSVRPEHVSVTRWPAATSSLGTPIGVLMGTISDIADLGTSLELFVAITAEIELQAHTPGAMDLHVGERCRIEFPPDAIAVWPVVNPAATRS
jgi:ABC-type Fe3+/spermidine/putrescine transport system ATPase subunit/ABC-type sulfate transport system permease component